MTVLVKCLNVVITVVQATIFLSDINDIEIVEEIYRQSTYSFDKKKVDFFSINFIARNVGGGRDKVPFHFYFFNYPF